MKQKLLITLSLLIAVNSVGQSPAKIDSVVFCLNKFKVPTGCVATSEYQLKCDNYSMVWLYMTAQMLQTMPEQFVNQMEQQTKKFKKEPATCFLLGKEVKGYKISFKASKGTTYQLIAYGIANGQPVLTQLSLGHQPETNEDIPDFPRQIIRLTK